MKICKICFRELEETQMKGEYCFTCLRMIGKGDGYKSEMSEKEAEKWMEGWEIRKEKLKKEGK